MDFNFFLGIIILLGAIQGFTICVYLYPKRVINPMAFRFFVVFLLSLALFNFLYAFKFLKIFIVPVPFPYKYLIGVGFFFYIKSNITHQSKVLYSPKAYYLFIPAIAYGILRIYWFILFITDINRNIMFEVYQTRFFTYNEFVYLSFDLMLAIFAIRWLKKYQHKVNISGQKLKNWQWLNRFSWVFLGFTLCNLLQQIFTLVFSAQDSGLVYSLILLLNSAFIYWIGFIGFSKSDLLFKKFNLTNEKSSFSADHSKVKSNLIEHKLKKAIEIEEVFTNPSLKIEQLAIQLEVSSKELSRFINETYQKNFSEYINHHRIEKVKKLLASPDDEKYTLVFIAEKSGFSSKSSFNASFKKITGLTPRQYRQQLPLKNV